MKKLIAVMVLLLALIAPNAMAAGSVTVDAFTTHGNMVIVQFDWIANATGAGEVPATSTDGEWPTTYTGCLYTVTTNPGSPAPTTDYDITLTNNDGVDLLGGQGADRSATVSEMVAPKIGTVFGCSPSHDNEGFTLNLSGNSVNSATGTVTIIIYEDTNGN